MSKQEKSSKCIKFYNLTKPRGKFEIGMAFKNI